MKQKRNSLYIFSITLVAAIGGLLFGYDTAVISGAEESLKVYFIDSLGLGSLAHGVTVSSALIGCIIGGVISGYCASKFGRKRSLIIAAILFIVSALGASYPEFLFFTKGEPTIVLLLAFNLYRIIGGIGVGLASAICPIYIGEIAPADIRGRLVSFNQFMIIFGMLVVYFVNWGIANGETLEWINDVGWRYMFASGVIPAIIFAILLLFVPETPRYLAIQHQDKKALAILTKINGPLEAKAILDDIKQTMAINVSSEKVILLWKISYYCRSVTFCISTVCRHKCCLILCSPHF